MNEAKVYLKSLLSQIELYLDAEPTTDSWQTCLRDAQDYVKQSGIGRRMEALREELQTAQSHEFRDITPEKALNDKLEEMALFHM